MTEKTLQQSLHDYNFPGIKVMTTKPADAIDTPEPEHIARFRAFKFMYDRGQAYASDEAIDGMKLLTDYDALRAERDALREWRRTIVTSGWLTHFWHCGIWVDDDMALRLKIKAGECDCGLDAALAAQERKP